MREIVIISGKGGTGKTSVSASFAHLAAEGGARAMLCDLDVDAPDLHLLLAPDLAEPHEFRSGVEAVIDMERCILCGKCEEYCRFGAVRQGASGFAVDALRCEGCGVCARFCPPGAIELREKYCGDWWVSSTRLGPLVHARLHPGEENSGRLVSLLKREAKERARAQGLGLVLCDGSPGIGCPVIASLSGASQAVIVTEPTPSGRHDLTRVAGLCAHFRIPAAVLVNKADLNPAGSDDIEAFCADEGLALLGRLPHDEAVVRAMLQGRCVSELPSSPFSEALRRAWQTLGAPASTGAAGRAAPRPGGLASAPPPRKPL